MLAFPRKPLRRSCSLSSSRQVACCSVKHCRPDTSPRRLPLSGRTNTRAAGDASGRALPFADRLLVPRIHALAALAKHVHALAAAMAHGQVLVPVARMPAVALHLLSHPVQHFADLPLPL